MPVHDWARVESGVFHHFHNTWIAQLGMALNAGLLPSDYYALTEQHAGRYVVDLLTLHGQSPTAEPGPPPAGAGTAVALAPPKVRHKLTVSELSRTRRKTLAIRHVSGHRLVAVLEIVSPANKDRAAHVEEFADKIEECLRRGIHVLLLDLWVPGPHDPLGMHGAVWERFTDEPFDLPPEEPLTLAAYVGGLRPEAYLEHLAIGSALPEMPLFLHPERYLNVPLEATCEAAYQGVPAVWRDVLEGRSAHPG